MKLPRSLLALCLLGHVFCASDPYTPLRLYDGTWKVARKDLPKPDELINQCSLIGKYFACQQTVNGSVGNLMIFIPAAQPGHYVTQGVNLQGRALGRGDLEIDGDRWVYSSMWDEGGKTTYYRTVNIFSGRNHIHFDQQESTNRKDWVTKNSGDETKVGR